MSFSRIGSHGQTGAQNTATLNRVPPKKQNNDTKTKDVVSFYMQDRLFEIDSKPSADLSNVQSGHANNKTKIITGVAFGALVALGLALAIFAAVHGISIPAV